MYARHAHSRPRRLRLLPLVLLLVVPAASCGDDGPSDEPAGPAVGPVTIDLDGRPFQLFVPDSYQREQPAPLVIGLHGFTSNSAQMESYFRITAQAEQRGFLYAMPDGTRNRGGQQFWNATDLCCDFSRSGVDDATYLSDLIDEVQRRYTVDADRVFLIGHSNGGYMAHRMACDHADQIAAIASLAGLVWSNPDQCTPARPVSVLQIHGTADATVAYAAGSGGGSGGGYPGAEGTVARWRQMDGCADDPGTAAPAVDLDRAVPGAETVATTYRDGCGGGTRVVLWRMEGSGHVPRLADAFTPAVIDFFYESVPS